MKRAPLVLLIVGLLQMAGAVLHVPVIRGLGAATGASPAPRVFTTMAGFEGFSTRFAIELEHRGERQRFEITPERYAQVRGAYNRRNAYGAVVAAGPALVSEPVTAAMYEPVARYAVCGEAPLLREMGIDPDEVRYPVTLVYAPQASTPSALPSRLDIDCEAP